MSNIDIAIIDSGGANLTSLMFALDRCSRKAVVSSDADVIRDADRVILPGVGAAGNAMQTLRARKLIDVIRKLTQPVLGICLGLQLLCERSDEEDVECLGVFSGCAARLAGAVSLPVPNMGWCPIEKTQEHPVLAGIGSGEHFYFVHSFAVPNNSQTVASASHSSDFSAVLAKDNFVATQFHPERSSVAGAKLLQNFLSWTP